MKRNEIYYAATILLSFVAASCSQSPAYKDASLSADERVKDLIGRMTVEEKIRQLDMYWGKEIAIMGSGHAANGVQHDASAYSEEMIVKTLGNTGVGSIHDFYPISAEITNQIQKYALEKTCLGISVLFIEEGLHGYEGFGSTTFLIPLQLAATWDSFIVRKIGSVIATETRSNGVNMILGPVLGLLRDKTGKKAGKNESPSLALIDSLYVKTTRLGGESRRINGGKKIKGRKRHIITDTMGLLLAVVVHAANVHDSKGANDVNALLKERFGRLVKIVTNGGYRGELIEKTKTAFGWILEIVLRTDHSSKFTVIPQRWVVERASAWFESYRRLSKDFEYMTDTSEATIQFSMIKIMLNRIKKYNLNSFF